MLEHLSIYTSSSFFFFFFDNIFHLNIHYVCMFVQHFEPQGRCFTSFHYYYNQQQICKQLLQSHQGGGHMALGILTVSVEDGGHACIGSGYLY